MELVPPRLHTAIVVTGTTGSSCGGGASTFRVSQSRRRHTIKIEFIIKLNDLASSRAHSRNYHNWKRTPLSLLTCLPQLVDMECAFMLCSWGLLPSCHGSFPASPCVHSVHETLYRASTGPICFLSRSDIVWALPVFPGCHRASPVCHAGPSTSGCHCRRECWHLTDLITPRINWSGFYRRQSATVQDIYKDRLQVVTLPVPLSTRRDA